MANDQGASTIMRKTLDCLNVCNEFSPHLIFASPLYLRGGVLGWNLGHDTLCFVVFVRRSDSFMLTDSVEPSPSCQCDSPSSAQEFFNILLNLKVRAHRSPPLVPILSQINTVYITPSLTYLIHVTVNL
jgi:hypothetical protein